MKQFLCFFFVLLFALPLALADHNCALKYDAPFYSGPGYSYPCEFGQVSASTAITIHAVITSDSYEQWAHVSFSDGKGNLCMAYTPMAYVQVYDPASTASLDTESMNGIPMKISGTTTVSYGPDSSYAARSARLQDGDTVYVVKNEGSYALIDYYQGSSRMRGYVPAASVRIETPKPTPKYRAGDVITLGHYEQDGDFSNGPEPIEWIVLEYYDQGIAVVISKYVLDGMPANYDYVDITWETSNIRNWLNGMFFETAFSTEEQKLIIRSLTWPYPNPYFDKDPGEPVNDYVRLATLNDAKEMFYTNKDRMCTATSYASSKGVKYQATWWLCAPCRSQKGFAGVDKYGAINYDGYHGDSVQGVRPMMNIRLD